MINWVPKKKEYKYLREWDVEGSRSDHPPFKTCPDLTVHRRPQRASETRPQFHRDRISSSTPDYGEKPLTHHQPPPFAIYPSNQQRQLLIISVHGLAIDGYWEGLGWEVDCAVLGKRFAEKVAGSGMRERRLEMGLLTWRARNFKILTFSMVNIILRTHHTLCIISGYDEKLSSLVLGSTIFSLSQITESKHRNMSCTRRRVVLRQRTTFNTQLYLMFTERVSYMCWRETSSRFFLISRFSSFYSRK